MTAKFIKIIGINVILLVLPFVQAYAYPLTSINLGQSSTIQNPLPFYCTVTNAKDTDHVYMKNKAVLVTGFTKHGHLTTNVQKVNQVYFNSYHDNSYPNEDGMVFVTVIEMGAIVTCQQGIGSGRTLMPGNYGMTDQ